MIKNLSQAANSLPLYALPDHEVVAALLPGRFDKLLDDTRATARIAAEPGLVPAAIEPDPVCSGGGRLYWVDIGRHPYRDWQHLFTIARLAGEGRIGTAFATSLRVLDDENLIPDALPPTGFIFHTSRCGSTLMGKALARVESHCVVNQGGPLQRGFWAAHNGDFTQDLPNSATTQIRFRNLIYALTRPRLGSECHSFVKFISWNTLYADFISQAFPETPCLFLFRDPVEVIASVMKATTAVLVAAQKPQAMFLTARPMEEIEKMTDAVYLAHCYNNYFNKILGFPMARLRALDYYDLTPGNFGEIMRQSFGFSAGEEALAKMCTQFGFHSKDDSDTSNYKDDGAMKRAAIAGADKHRIKEITKASLAALRAGPMAVFGESLCGFDQNLPDREGTI